MDPETLSSMRRLLDMQRVAALATLHRGEPAVSMVPYVLPPDAAHFVIHASSLATHTQDMLAHPRIGLLVTAELTSGVSPQALPRVSVQADAQRLLPEDALHAPSRAHYLARFADAAITFELADFSLFVLRPVSARLVAGFGRAHGLTGDRLFDWLRATAC